MRNFAIIFDFDGTLVKSNAIKKACFYQVIPPFLFAKDAMDQALGEAIHDRFYIFSCFKEILNKKGIHKPIDIAGLVNKYEILTEKEVALAPEMPGAIELLEYLKENKIPAFLNSATPLVSLKKIIKKRGWEDYFSGIYGLPADKVENILQIKKSISDDELELIVIGDGIDDRISADYFGYNFLSVGEGRGSSTDSEIYTLDQVKDFISYI